MYAYRQVTPSLSVSPRRISDISFRGTLVSFLTAVMCLGRAVLRLAQGLVGRRGGAGHQFVRRRPVSRQSRRPGRPKTITSCERAVTRLVKQTRSRWSVSVDRAGQVNE